MSDLARFIPGKDGAQAILCAKGEIDLSNVGQFRDALEDAIDEYTQDFLLDLSGLDYIDSSGIRILFDTADRLKTIRIALRVRVKEPSTIRAALTLCGFDAVATLEPL